MTSRSDYLREMAERYGLTTDDDRRDEHLVERAERLAALVQSDVWRKDLLPILEHWAERAVHLMAHVPDLTARAEMAGCYKTLLGLVTQVGGRLEVGRRALGTLAERRLGLGGGRARDDRAR